MIWTPESAKNPWVNLEACGFALSIWNRESLNLILPPLWFINRFPVDSRHYIIFTESIEAPLGRAETEYFFGLQVKLTITIVFQCVSLDQDSWVLFLPFTIQFFREHSASHANQDSSSTQ